MGTKAVPVEPGPRTIDPSLRIGAVHLAVADVPRSVQFYAHALGLPLIARDERGASLGPDRERPALRLTGLENPVPVAPHSTGLFHVAWLHPSRAALAGTIERILQAGWPIHGASDHGVSEALYLSDPDGLGVEIYADRPRERWPRPAGGHGVDMVTRPLDIDDLLAQAPLEPAPELPAAIALGHVHLKVPDVPRAAAFYRDALGFAEQARLPGAAFLSAGGYHHHVALNSWQSSGAGPPADSAPGLRLLAFELVGADALAQLEDMLAAAPGGPVRAERSPGRVCVEDPAGNRLAFVARSPA
jgi:catechol 2,3-dioxygenase